MATAYLPAQGQIRVVDQFEPPIKHLLSTNPRQFPPGSPMWQNKVAGRYQAEPSLLTTQQATVDVSAATASADSGYATLAAANLVFAPLFLGLALEGRVSQQLAQLGNYSAPYPQTIYPQDASRPYISICPSGVAIAPLMAAASQAYEVGNLVQVAGFANDAVVTGFYDPAGRRCNTAGGGYWQYLNAVDLASADATGCIGFIVERVEIGDTEVKFRFYSALNNAVLTLGV